MADDNNTPKSMLKMSKLAWRLGIGTFTLYNNIDVYFNSFDDGFRAALAYLMQYTDKQTALNILDEYAEIKEQNI